ncbi:hypothetical protein [Leptospira levettii]|uniref:hypothetical protein n=1 Tax=Leptospira levettii TaxID=2023178 RepID=UPI000C2A1D5D|nr:hypothetical protein [Leptospira levettii]PJZ86887.1 hypothetical protein CH368_19690 [Leptospira levettii]
MNLFEIQSMISSSEEMLRNIEAEIQIHPNIPSLKSAYKSLNERKQSLEEMYLAEAKKSGYEVCNYRIIPSTQSVTLPGLGELLNLFQNLYSSIYDAILKGSRDRSRFSKETLSNSIFSFGFSYAGSLGLILTLPKETLLYGEPTSIVAFEKFHELINVNSTNAITDFGKQYGPSVLRSLYKWTKHHLDYRYNIDVSFLPPDSNEISFQLQKGSFERIFSLLNSTAEKTFTPINFEGQLVGIDTDNRTFHIKNLDEDIKGFLAGDFSLNDPIAVLKYYKAKIIRESELKYSSDYEDYKYYLESLTLTNQNDV